MEQLARIRTAHTCAQAELREPPEFQGNFDPHIWFDVSLWAMTVPFVRDRLIAGAVVPASLVNQAQKFRRWYRARVLELFKSVDVIIAPATPCFTSNPTSRRPSLPNGSRAFVSARRHDVAARGEPVTDGHARGPGRCPAARPEGDRRSRLARAASIPSG